MFSIRNRRARWFRHGASLALALVAIVALAACGDDDGEGEVGGARATAPADGTGSLDYGSLDGNIDIDGSSTVYPISAAMAEEFGLVSDVRVNVSLSGTGGGFEKFCRGETQVSDASRPIKQEEIEACADNGIDDIVEFQVAIDALTIVVNPENDWATCMTVEQAVEVFRADGATHWSDIDPSWPDEPIITFYPGADSGTFDYFVEVMEELDEGYVHTSSGTSSENDNILVAGVQGDRNAIGYFGLAYYVGAGQDLNAVAIDNGNGCVEPSAETAQGGEYAPYSRPLFIYTREAFLRERPEVLGFVNFYFELMDEVVPDEGYATMSESQKAEQVAKLAPFLP